jgi:hypothetical protein
MKCYSCSQTHSGVADRPVDNLSIDTNEALWAAGFPDGLAFFSAYHDLEKVSPSSAIRITKNVGNKAFFGEKVNVEKVRKQTLWCTVSGGPVTYISSIGIRR